MRLPYPVRKAAASRVRNLNRPEPEIRKRLQAPEVGLRVPDMGLRVSETPMVRSIVRRNLTAPFQCARRRGLASSTSSSPSPIWRRHFNVSCLGFRQYEMIIIWVFRKLELPQNINTFCSCFLKLVSRARVCLENLYLDYNLSYILRLNRWNSLFQRRWNWGFCTVFLAKIFPPFIADIRRSSRPFLVDKAEDDFFQIDVRVIILLSFSPS